MRTIDYLAAENRAERSTSLESAIVELRQRAGELVVTRGLGDLEQGPTDGGIRFSGVKGLPEIGAHELCVEAISEGVLEHGALLVRGFFDDVTVDRLVARLRDEQEPRGQDSTASVPGYGCSSASLCALIEAYQDNGFLDCVRRYFGEPILLHAERAKLRRHIKGRDAFAAIPWHQDVNFFGQKAYALNVWSALNPVGEDTPGLAIVPRRVEERIGWSGDGLAPLDYGKELSPSLLEEFTSHHPIAYPVLAPGDAVVFDEMTLHSTASKQWRTPEQLVAISWFFRASRFPCRGTPIAA